MFPPGHPLALITSIAAVLALATGGHWLGGRLVRRLDFPSPGERAAAALLVGLGLIAHGTMLLGLAGLLYRPVAVALLAAGAALGARRIRPRLPAPRVVALLLLLALPALLVALRPPTAFDATTYHLPCVRFYVETHAVHPPWDLRFPVFPQLSEMLFTLVTLAGGEPAPALVEALFATATALLIAGWARRAADLPTAALALGLWFGSPLVFEMATVPYIDMTTAAYATLAALAVERALATEARAWGALAGAAAGFAASSKYLGLAVGLTAGAALLVGRRWRGLPAFAAAAIPLAVPWYIYAAAHTGNPVQPFLASWFGDRHWNAGDLERQMSTSHLGRGGVSLSSLLHLPWDLTFNQRILGPDPPYVKAFLFVVPLTPLALRARWLRLPLGLVAAHGALWFAGGLHSLRYLIYTSPLFALVAAGLFVEAARRVRLPRLAPVVLALGLSARTSARAARSLLDDGFPLSAAARHGYLAGQLADYDVYPTLARLHPGGYVVYAFDMERMSYFVERGRQVGEHFGPWRFVDFRPLLADPPALAARLAAAGVDHLLVGRGDLAPTPQFRLEWQSGTRELYELVTAR